MSNRSKAPDNPAAELTDTDLRNMGLLTPGAPPLSGTIVHDAPAKPKRQRDPARYALAKIERILEEVSQPERQRIIHWLAHEYHCALDKGPHYE